MTFEQKVIFTLRGWVTSITNNNAPATVVFFNEIQSYLADDKERALACMREQSRYMAISIPAREHGFRNV